MTNRFPHLLREGNEALADGAWEKARLAFQDALRLRETAEAFEGLSWACWWLSEANPLFETRERAYKLYRKKGDRRGAARMAIWIASDYVDFRAQMAIANGWRRRAGRLLEDMDPVPEHGWLRAHEAALAIEVHNDTVTARRLGAEAVEWGRRLNVVDLEALGLTVQGLALVGEGHVGEGIALLDEAMASAMAGELEQPLTMGWVTCHLICACEYMRDFERAEQWCRKMEEIAGRLKFRFWLGVCRIHYAGVLTWRGKWYEAEAELVDSTSDLEKSRPPYAVEAIVRLADLRRRQGRLEEAVALFARAGEHPLALLGNAEIALESGFPDQAEDLLQRYLRQTPQDNRALRAPALELQVATYLSLGKDAEAAAALETLKSVAAMLGTEPVRASAAYAGGLVDAAAGDFVTARQKLEDAVHLFLRSGAPYEASRARVELANVLSVIGLVAAAQNEAGAALQEFRRIGATREAERAAILMKQTREPLHGALTRREMEVLRFVAEGLGDKEIASRLSISGHTVHRHISNIRLKLDVPSRAAAVAIAARNSLI